MNAVLILPFFLSLTIGIYGAPEGSTAVMEAILTKFRAATNLKPWSFNLNKKLNCSGVEISTPDYTLNGPVTLSTTQIWGLDKFEQDPPVEPSQSRPIKGEEKEYLNTLQGRLKLPGLLMQSTVYIPVRYGNNNEIAMEAKLIAITENNPLTVHYKVTYIESLKRLVIRELRFEPHLELFFDSLVEGFHFEMFEECILNKGREAFGVVEQTLINFIKKALVKAVATT